MKLNKNSYAFIFAVVFGICWIPPTAFSEDKHMDHGSMDHGSMDPSNSPEASGDEYRTKPEEMDHDHMDHCCMQVGANHHKREKKDSLFVFGELEDLIVVLAELDHALNEDHLSSNQGLEEVS